MVRFIRSLQVAFVAVLVAGVLAFGGMTAYPAVVTAAQQCDLPGPCGDCNKRCQDAGFFGGDCNTQEDCCLCMM